MFFSFNFVPTAKASAAIHRGVAGDGRHKPGADALGDVIDKAADAGDTGGDSLDEVFAHVDIVDGGDDIDDIRKDANLLRQCRTDSIDFDNTNDHDEVAIEDDQEVRGFVGAQCNADHDIPHGVPHLLGRGRIEGFEYGLDVVVLDGGDPVDTLCAIGGRLLLKI